jgi:hypothetical protein
MLQSADAVEYLNFAGSDIMPIINIYTSHLVFSVQYSDTPIQGSFGEQ